MDSEPAAAVRLMTMIHASWQTHAVAAFAEFGLADLLAAGPRPVAELAREAGADPAVFPRFVRACQSLGLVAGKPQGQVRLTGMGRLLRTGDASLRDFALFHATPGQLRPDELLSRALRDGKPTAAAALGEPVWEYYASRPDESHLLAAAINSAAAIEAPAVAGAIDLAGCRTIVELRGGVTAILAALLEAAPWARGVLADRPEIVAASLDLIGEHLRDRVAAHAGAALEPPPGVRADMYLISHGLHFAGQDGARDALARLRDSGHERTRLVIIDPVLTADTPAVVNLLDLHTLMLLGGCERTAEDFAALLSASGWRLEKIVPGGVLSGVVMASPA